MAAASASDRLVDTATRLFYERGIAASGVDTIVAESGVSKPTLYVHFRTKARLVTAALERQHEERRASLAAHLAARAGLPPGDRLLSVFDWVAGLQRGEWARGCPFVNASVELVRPEDGEARAVVTRHKRWFRGELSRLAAQAGATDPAAVASELHLLVEGANARMLAEGDTGAIEAARNLARIVLAAAGRPPLPGAAVHLSGTGWPMCHYRQRCPPTWRVRRTHACDHTHPPEQLD